MSFALWKSIAFQHQGLSMAVTGMSVCICVFVSTVYQVVIAPGVLQASLLLNSGPPGHLVVCLCVLLSVFHFYSMQKC